MKQALVAGAGGFIGHHMVKRLKAEGYFVRGVDRKYPEFEKSPADQFFIADLRRPEAWVYITPDVSSFDEVYQFAANMGGMGFLGDPANDAATLRDNMLINLHILDNCIAPIEQGKKPKVFFASSACVYPFQPPKDGHAYAFAESDAYPAQPDLEYGFEKLFSERLYQSYAKVHGLDVRIARFHNIMGPLGTWDGGREKAPAAICRKVALAKRAHWPKIEVWGDGEQQRSFCYIDDAIEGVRRLMSAEGGWGGPVNIGSSEMVSINRLVDLVCVIADVDLKKKYIPGPEGVRGRNSDNTLIQQTLGWQPSISLKEGLAKTYQWIEEQVRLTSKAA